MSGAELALETQLLLQEVTQAKQFEVAVDAEGPSLSEFELAKQALVDKLRKKKEQNRQQLQQRNLKRYGFAGAAAKMTSPPLAPVQPAAQAAGNRVTPVKQKQMGLPVIAAAPAASRKKKELLLSLRKQAIKQGSQEMAKLFGYNSYEEHIKHLNKIEKMKILQSELQESKQGEEGEGPNAVEGGSDVEEADVDEDVEMVGENDGAHDEEDTSMETPDIASETQDQGEESVLPAEPSAPVAIDVGHDDDATTATVSKEASQASSRSPVTRRRRNQIQVDDDEEDGNEADSEQDDKEDAEEEKEEVAAVVDDKPKDRAAAFRRLLQEEAKQNRQRKRLRKGADFVESEAEEEEEEDALRIGGLGDFGFGVPQAATKESTEAEAERNALNMREDDLEGIVDDLSDEEKEQAQDLDEIYRRELEEQDRQQVKEVMRNVKEGFGRNRRAFSGLDAAGARGRFNLNELTAADGSKLEAARLGLLESDEELMDDDDENKEKEEENEEAEEEDEEAEMERLLRERFLNQPKIYITSSESEGEEENEVEKAANDTAGEEIESDEERERQQMKLFSERARINRRMQRMKEVQRQVAIENEEEVVKAPLPNLLLEEDEESQELLKVLNRTDVAPAAAANTASSNSSRLPSTARSGRPGVKRFNSFGMSSARSSSSFSRVAKNCKLFSTGSGSSAPKGFVFTSFSSDKAEQADENTNSVEDSGSQPSSQPGLAKSQSWGGSGSRGVKRPFGTTGANASSTQGSNKKRKGGKSDFFSVLASYQCVSQDTSAPM